MTWAKLNIHTGMGIKPGRIAAIAALAIALNIVPSCSVNYSFTGASISPDVKTVSVELFQNLASLVNPTLSTYLTEELKNKFISQTRLSVVSGFGDLTFSGEIRNYQVQPVAIQSDEVAALNRFTISVRVKFENSKDPTQNYDRTFSQFQDFESRQDFAQVEQGLMETIVAKLVEDIFNNAVANW
ncbi:MAG TPA: LptE family protein [Tenuifilaceae bacterium]|nr:LptE family protein [Tenuifilaceae bacterium]